MSNVLEVPVRVHVLRDELGIGESYMTAILKECGLKHARLVHRSTVLQFLKDNPTWRMPRPVKKAA